MSVQCTYSLSGARILEITYAILGVLFLYTSDCLFLFLEFLITFLKASCLLLPSELNYKIKSATKKSYSSKKMMFILGSLFSNTAYS